MNTNNVISIQTAVDLTGHEHECVKLTATGVDLAGAGDRIIGTLLRGQTKREDGGSVVGMAVDVFLSAGCSKHFAKIGDNTAIALGDELERDDVAGRLTKRVSGKVAALAASACPINSDGGIIEVIMLPTSGSGIEPPTQTQTSLTDSSTGAVSTTLAAVSAAVAASTDTTAASLTSTNAAITSLKNGEASIAAELALIKADVANLIAALAGA